MGRFERVLCRCYDFYIRDLRICGVNSGSRSNPLETPKVNCAVSTVQMREPGHRAV